MAIFPDQLLGYKGDRMRLSEKKNPIRCLIVLLCALSTSSLPALFFCH